MGAVDWDYRAQGAGGQIVGVIGVRRGESVVIS